MKTSQMLGQNLGAVIFHDFSIQKQFFLDIETTESAMTWM